MHSSGERGARFESLYRKHAAAVLAYALRRSSPEDAADAAAETFVVAWRRLADVPEEQALPWLYATARRVLSMQRRAARRQEAIATRVAFERPDQLAVVQPETALPLVVRALAELREGEQEVLMLAAWEELSSRDAAAVIGCSATAYRIRLHRARLRLSRALSDLETASLAAQRSVDPTIKENLSC
jgi:RNA polymerase sigma-70 factor (ECF subfamily)